MAPPAPWPGVRRGPPFVGKAVLFARDDLTFPARGVWDEVLRSPGPLEEMPAYADLPHAGERIAAGRPVLTLFVRDETPAACLQALRRTAIYLDHDLFAS
jgi:hypothetical protein